MRCLRVCGGMGLLVAFSVALVGCLERPLAPLSPCQFSVVTESRSVRNIDAVDVLFMIDNSISMRDEQVALLRELPALVRVLSSGDRDGDGAQDFRPVELRLGVVSSDLGTPGIPDAGACHDSFGDNAALLHTPIAGVGVACQASYPPFLSFSPPTGPDANAAVDRFANDFACISALGTTGCGFEQQLEATLKALWPSDNRVDGVDMLGALGPFPGFLGQSDGQGRNGNGDPAGINAGFLRNDATGGKSLIAVILVTDEEDCSSWNLEHVLPDALLGPDHPLKGTHPNLHCMLSKQNLFPVQRYIDGLKALRPGEEMVVFAAIAGVPKELVNDQALSRVDFADQAQRDAFYDGILRDPNMVESINAAGDNLNTSCTNLVNGEEQRAFPPRRIVEVAKAFGRNGIVQSICESSFAPAMSRIIDLITANIADVCLPRKLVRNIDGEVDCRVVWELPTSSTVAPTRCDDPRFSAFLRPPSAGRRQTTDAGRVLCEVQQVPVVPCVPSGPADERCFTTPQGAIGPAPGGAGWFYDDFSSEVQTCRGPDKQLVSFSDGARPPTGVVVRLECTKQVQSLGVLRDDVLPGANVPQAGDLCTTDLSCHVPLADPLACAQPHPFRQDVGGVCTDVAMFCHDIDRQCVIACTNNAECPPAWQCDVEGVITPLAETRNHPICVNPTCGS